MEFKIKFQAVSQDEYFKGIPYSLSIYDRVIGILDVDFIRKETECANLTLDRIRGCIDSKNRNPECEIPESLARQSGLFEYCNELVIETPLYWLNQFAGLKVEKNISQETGEILRAQLRVSINFDAALQDWADRGFPREIEAPEDYEVEFYLHPPVE